MTYSSALSIGRGQYGYSMRRNQNVVGFRADHEHRFGPIANTIILIVLACTLGVLYLSQVTKTNALGYQINTFQEKQTKLKAEHDNLVLASAQLQSLDRVRHSEVATKLVAVAPSGTVN